MRRSYGERFPSKMLTTGIAIKQISISGSRQYVLMRTAHQTKSTSIIKASTASRKPGASTSAAVGMQRSNRQKKGSKGISAVSGSHPFR